MLIYIGLKATSFEITFKHAKENRRKCMTRNATVAVEYLSSISEHWPYS